MNKYRKINGLTRKLSCEQLISYIAVLIEVGVFSGIVLVCLTEVTWLVIVGGIYGLLFVIKLIYGAILTLNDPSDPLLITSQKGHNSQIMRIIKQNPQNYQFCHHCQAHTHISSKHCQKCRRCVYGFDHHCKWINNCVSRSYYHHFVVFIVVQELELVDFVLGAILVTVSSEPKLQQWQLIALWIVTSFVIIFMMLLLVLIIISFHLISIGMKTQEWLVTKKSNKIAPILDYNIKNITYQNLSDPHISPAKRNKYQMDMEIISEKIEQIEEQDKKQQYKCEPEPRRGLFPQQNQYGGNSYLELEKKKPKPKEKKDNKKQSAYKGNQNTNSIPLICLINFFLVITTIEKNILPPKVHLKLSPSITM